MRRDYDSHRSSTSPILTATARFTRHSLYYTLQYVLLTTNLTYWSAFATCGTKMRRDYDSHRSSTSPILTATARFTRHSLYYTLQYVLLTTNLTLLGSLCNVFKSILKALTYDEIIDSVTTEYWL
uniref:Uncharacterized protein n=1 Tax=Glossina austeni TaxID=7395 RepID=A0A1A9VMN3_GLOAU